MLHFIVVYFIAFKIKKKLNLQGSLCFSEVDVQLIKCQINCTVKDEVVRQWLRTHAELHVKS